MNHLCPAPYKQFVIILFPNIEIDSFLGMKNEIFFEIFLNVMKIGNRTKNPF